VDTNVNEGAVVEDITNNRRSNFLSAMEQRASATSITDIPLNQHQHILERHTKSLRETCSMSVAGKTYYLSCQKFCLIDVDKI
jgi:hypothetical protein